MFSHLSIYYLSVYVLNYLIELMDFFFYILGYNPLLFYFFVVAE